MHEDYYANKHQQRHGNKKEEPPKPKPVVVGDADQPVKPGETVMNFDLFVQVGVLLC